MHPNYYYNPYRIQVEQQTIEDHLPLHQGHCFKAFWGGREHTFRLLSITTQGMVRVIENGYVTDISRHDIVGLTYLGPQCPSAPTPGTGGPGPGTGGPGPGTGGPGPGTGGPGPGTAPGPNCQWVGIPGLGGTWVCW
ncbi:hypothetical protein [Bacillus sp. SM2101]|uniref:hypothetical protein n=1 Tax=Bacillus sp. SM2101 TaxID=2805366 RepID=UPI001BDE059B|nr:hypothetical protein [Bacillus sp. SM2101]